MSHLTRWTAAYVLTVASLTAQAQDVYNSALASTEVMPRSAESLLLDIVKLTAGYVAVGERGHILRSSDGRDWQQVADVPSRSTLTSVFAVGDRLWAAGHDSIILFSGDAGQSWAVQNVAEDVFNPDLNNPLLDIFFLDEQRGFAMGAYATLLATSDGGKTWEEREFTLGAATDAAAQDDSDMADDEEFGDDYGDDEYEDFIDFHFNGMAMLDDGTLYIAAERGNGYVSNDDGETWAAVTLPYGGSMFGVLATGPQTLLTYGMRGHVFESGDSGQSWTEVATGSLNTLMGAMEDADSGLVLVGANGELLVRGADGSFQSRRHAGGGDLAGIVSRADGWVVVGEDGVADYQAEAGEAP